MNRSSAAVPTLVNRASLVAGQGPPCCMAVQTSTPVGQPLTISRPARVANSSSSGAASARSSGLPCSVAVSCPSSRRAICSNCSADVAATTTANGPKTSSASRSEARNVSASVSTTRPAASVRTASAAAAARASTCVPGWLVTPSRPCSKASRISPLSIEAGATAASDSATAALKRSSSGPATAKTSPGLVQNWPTPSVIEPTKP